MITFSIAILILMYGQKLIVKSTNHEQYTRSIVLIREFRKILREGRYFVLALGLSDLIGSASDWLGIISKLLGSV